MSLLRSLLRPLQRNARGRGSDSLTRMFILLQTLDFHLVLEKAQKVVRVGFVRAVFS